jgi:hypothetical protein
MWFNNPHEPPSGVWTGHMNPQDSGKSFLTVVVFISVKYWPLCILLKWDRYLTMLSLSAIIVNPAVYWRSKLDLDIRFPVAIKCSSFFPILVC